MSDDDKQKKDRGNALKERLSGSSETAETSKTSKTEESSEKANPSETSKMEGAEETAKRSKTAETAETVEASKPSETAKTSETVKDRQNVNMYLPDDLIDEMGIRYSELNAQFQREHGRELEKNRDFYPIMLELAFEKMEELGPEAVAERMD